MAANRELWAAAYRTYQAHAEALETAQQDQLSDVFISLGRECCTLSNENGREGQLLSAAICEMLEYRMRQRFFPEDLTEKPPEEEQ